MIDEARMRFGPLDLRYDAAGLRPRPWTQLQSAWAVELLPDLPPGDALELCAGVGQIGLVALLTAERAGGLGRRLRLVQVDQDERVCDLAERNAQAAGLAERVTVRRGRPEDVLRPEERFVLVLADPPWVPTDRVRDHPDDPPFAIDGGPDGLEVVRALLPVIERHLAGSGAALLQVGGHEQVSRVVELLESAGSELRVAGSRPAPEGQEGAVALLVHRSDATSGGGED